MWVGLHPVSLRRLLLLLLHRLLLLLRRRLLLLHLLLLASRRALQEALFSIEVGKRWDRSAREIPPRKEHFFMGPAREKIHPYGTEIQICLPNFRPALQTLPWGSLIAF